MPFITAVGVVTPVWRQATIAVGKDRKLTDFEMEVPNSLRLARQLAADRVAKVGSDSEFAREISRLLDQALSEWEVSTSRPRRRGEGAEYLVEKVGGVETLVEHRLSGKAKPFRCPKDRYDAIVQVLSAAGGPMSVEEITTAIPELSSGRAAEFQIRVPLRLWMNCNPSLITRSHAKYVAVDRQKFEARSAELWDRHRK